MTRLLNKQARAQQIRVNSLSIGVDSFLIGPDSLQLSMPSCSPKRGEIPTKKDGILSQRVSLLASRSATVPGQIVPKSGQIVPKKVPIGTEKVPIGFPGAFKFGADAAPQTVVHAPQLGGLTPQCSVTGCSGNSENSDGFSEKSEKLQGNIWLKALGKLPKFLGQKYKSLGSKPGTVRFSLTRITNISDVCSRNVQGRLRPTIGADMTREFADIYARLRAQGCAEPHFEPA